MPFPSKFSPRLRQLRGLERLQPGSLRLGRQQRAAQHLVLRSRLDGDPATDTRGAGSLGHDLTDLSSIYGENMDSHN